MALVYGAPVGVSPDGGESWSQMDAKSSHVDWAVVAGAVLLVLYLVLKRRSSRLNARA